MSAPERKVERGVFFLSKPRREAWEQMVRASHEHAADEAEACELQARACQLALELWIARKAA